MKCKFKIVFFLIISYFSIAPLVGNTIYSEGLKNLDEEILRRDVYLDCKQKKIDSLKSELQNPGCQHIEICKYNLYSQLSDQYRSFVYDSAFVYTQKLLSSAIHLNDVTKEKEAKIKLAFVLLSSGLFTEAKDMIESIDIRNESDELRLGYYTIYSRIFYDLADYANDTYYSREYMKRGNVYQDSVIKLQHDPKLRLAATAQKEMKANDYVSAIKSYEILLGEKDLTSHEIAIAASSLGYLYSLRGESEKAINSLIQAAVADIQSVTKETVALRNLGSMLFEYDGNLERAYEYMRIAYEDAQFYNARHRVAEVSTILPILQKEKIRTVEEQRNQYIRFLILVSLLALVGVVFLIIIFVQNQKLKETKKIVLKNNKQLHKVNARLQESNKIKEQYIGYFFRMNSEFIQKQILLRRKITKIIHNKEFDRLKALISDEELESLRADLFQNFDKIFLKIFPSFIEDFNALFKEEDRVVVDKSELLNTDLRIYALIRLGIRDNEDIAEFLNYSVNTIYTYKTKIKNKSIVNNDDFEKEIMKIKAV